MNNTDKTYTIECEITPTIKVRLTNVRKIYGHDDSVPFNADVYARIGDIGQKRMKFLGRAWNDGWGGSATIDPCLSGEESNIIDALDDFINKHFKMSYQSKRNGETYYIAMDYYFVLDMLAFYAVEGIKTTKISKWKGVIIMDEENMTINPSDLRK